MDEVQKQLLLSKSAFWDTDVDALDAEVHKEFIIPRVFMHGSLDDYKAVLRRYTKEEITTALRGYRGLDRVTKEFAQNLGYL